MYECTIENAFGERVKLTQNESNFQVLNIGGLNPPSVQINHSQIAGLDGSKYNSSRLNDRNIVLTVRIRGDIEGNRLYLYQLFSLKQECKLYYKNGRRNVYISGRIESIECDYFTNMETMQISILCPFPYFKDVDLILDDISKIIRRFVFPFTIEYDDPIPFSDIEINRVVDVFNHGESECGVIIDVGFIGTVNKLKILNTGTGETFTIQHPFVLGDKLVINTNKGEKSATLTRDGAVTNMFPKIVRGSTFFNLNRGDNYFSFLADDGDHDSNVTIVYKHYTLYGGV